PARPRSAAARGNSFLGCGGDSRGSRRPASRVACRFGNPFAIRRPALASLIGSIGWRREVNPAESCAPGRGANLIATSRVGVRELKDEAPKVVRLAARGERIVILRYIIPRGRPWLRIARAQHARREYSPWGSRPPNGISNQVAGGSGAGMTLRIAAR